MMLLVTQIGGGDVCGPREVARLVDCGLSMSVQEAVLVARPEQTSTPIGAGVSFRLVVPEEHVRLQIGCLSVPLSSPVIVVPEDCSDLGGPKSGIVLLFLRL